MSLYKKKKEPHETLHYHNKDHSNYPFSICGYTGIGIRCTEDIKQVNCKKCAQSIQLNS